MKTDQIKEAARKLRELATALAGLNLSKTDGGMDELLDSIHVLWIESYNALVQIKFQPPSDLRRVAGRAGGTAWLMAIADELETEINDTE